MTRATVLVADDHVLVADALRSLLRDDFELVGSVASGEALLTAAELLRPDVIVCDLAMPGLGALDVLRQLAGRRIPSRVIVLTMHGAAHLAAESIRLGAWGYVLKTSAGDELITAIREVAAGRRFLTAALTAEEIDLPIPTEPADPATARPTARQLQVLRLIAAGKRMKEIATILGVSPRTVESHKYEMMELLGLRSTAELIRYAMHHPELGADVAMPGGGEGEWRATNRSNQDARTA